MERISQKIVAEKLGLGQPYLSELLSGKRRASRKVALRLERLTDISVRVWLYGERAEICSCLENFLGKKINFGRGALPGKRKK